MLKIVKKLASISPKSLHHGAVSNHLYARVTDDSPDGTPLAQLIGAGAFSSDSDKYVSDSTPSQTGSIGNPAMVRLNRNSGDIHDNALLQMSPNANFGVLKTTNLHKIDEAYSALTRGLAKDARLFIVVGVDPYELPKSSLANNAVIQVASQFNFLESTGTHRTKTEDYVDDRSQGSRASLAVPSSLIIRDAQYAGASNDPNHSTFGTLSGYENGCFRPSIDRKHPGKYISVLGHLEGLNILIQGWVRSAHW